MAQPTASSSVPVPAREVRRSVPLLSPSAKPNPLDDAHLVGSIGISAEDIDDEFVVIQRGKSSERPAATSSVVAAAPAPQAAAAAATGSSAPRATSKASDSDSDDYFRDSDDERDDAHSDTFQLSLERAHDEPSPSSLHMHSSTAGDDGLLRSAEYRTFSIAAVQPDPATTHVDNQATSDHHTPSATDEPQPEPEPEPHHHRHHQHHHHHHHDDAPSVVQEGSPEHQPAQAQPSASEPPTTDTEKHSSPTTTSSESDTTSSHDHDHHHHHHHHHRDRSIDAHEQQATVLADAEPRSAPDHKHQHTDAHKHEHTHKQEHRQTHSESRSIAIEQQAASVAVTEPTHSAEGKHKHKHEHKHHQPHEHESAQETAPPTAPAATSVSRQPSEGTGEQKHSKHHTKQPSSGSSSTISAAEIAALKAKLESDAAAASAVIQEKNKALERECLKLRDENAALRGQLARALAITPPPPPPVDPSLVSIPRWLVFTLPVCLAVMIVLCEHKWLKQQKKSLPLLNELVALKASSSSTTAAALETERFLLSSLDRAIQQFEDVVLEMRELIQLEQRKARKRARGTGGADGDTTPELQRLNAIADMYELELQLKSSIVVALRRDTTSNVGNTYAMCWDVQPFLIQEMLQEQQQQQQQQQQL